MDYTSCENCRMRRGARKKVGGKFCFEPTGCSHNSKKWLNLRWWTKWFRTPSSEHRAGRRGRNLDPMDINVDTFLSCHRKLWHNTMFSSKLKDDAEEEKAEENEIGSPEWIRTVLKVSTHYGLLQSHFYIPSYLCSCVFWRERERESISPPTFHIWSRSSVFFFHRPTVPCHRRVRLVFGAFIPNICVGRSWFGRFLLSRYGSFQDCWLEPSNFSAEKERGDEGCTLLAPLCPIHTIDPLIDLTSVSNHPSCLALFYQLQSPPPPHPPSPPLPVPPLSYLTSSWIQMTWVSTFSWAFFSSRSDKAWKKFKAHEEEFSIDLMRRNHVSSSVVSWFFTRFESSHFQRRNDFAR